MNTLWFVERYKDAGVRGQTLPVDQQNDRVARFEPVQDPLEIFLVVERLTVELLDHIVGSQSGVVGDAARINAGDQNAFRAFQVGVERQLRMEVPDADAQVILGRVVAGGARRRRVGDGLTTGTSSDHDGKRHRPPVAVNLDRRRRPDGGRGHAAQKVLIVFDPLAAEFHDHVVLFQPGLRRRAFDRDAVDFYGRFDVADDRPARGRQAVNFCDLRGYSLRHRAQEPANDPSLFDQLLVDGDRFGRGNGEADAVVIAGRRGDQGVDADDLARKIDQRAA